MWIIQIYETSASLHWKNVAHTVLNNSPSEESLFEVGVEAYTLCLNTLALLEEKVWSSLLGMCVREKKNGLGI